MEKWIEARPLEPPEFADPALSPRIAASLRQLHAVPVGAPTCLHPTLPCLPPHQHASPLPCAIWRTRESDRYITRIGVCRGALLIAKFRSLLLQVVAFLDFSVLHPHAFPPPYPSLPLSPPPQIDEPRTPKVWPSIREWLDTAAALQFDDEKKRARFADVDFALLRAEAAEAEAACAALRSPVVFCHNDLLAPNVLIEAGGCVRVVCVCVLWSPPPQNCCKIMRARVVRLQRLFCLRCGRGGARPCVHCAPGGGFHLRLRWLLGMWSFSTRTLPNAARSTSSTSSTDRTTAGARPARPPFRSRASNLRPRSVLGLPHRAADGAPGKQHAQLAARGSSLARMRAHIEPWDVCLKCRHRHATGISTLATTSMSGQVSTQTTPSARTTDCVAVIRCDA